MNLDRFHRTRRARWDELEQLVREAHGKPERLGPERVRHLGALYRAAAADLALARRRFPGDPTAARLERLVAGARQLVYAESPRRFSLRRFAAHGYWRRVREQPRPLLLASGLLLVPLLLGVLWASEDPGAAIGVVPEEFLPTVESPGGDQGLSGAEGGAFSSSVFTNNVQVSMLALAAGIAFGVGTALVLAYNGLLLGAVVGLTIDNGEGVALLEQVGSHGPLELSCIVVAAGAGFRIGDALLRPGPRRRVDALAEEARGAVEVVIGTAPWLALAGLTEGFVSPRGIGATAALAVGLLLAAVYWTLVVRLGAPRDDEDAAEPADVAHSRARAFALR